MAYTVSHLVSTVVGNLKMKAVRVTADAATGSIETGLENVRAVSVTNQSATSAGYKVAMNEGVAGTSIAGTVAITGAASGDELIVMVYGV